MAAIRYWLGLALLLPSLAIEPVFGQGIGVPRSEQRSSADRFAGLTGEIRIDSPDRDGFSFADGLKAPSLMANGIDLRIVGVLSLRGQLEPVPGEKPVRLLEYPVKLIATPFVNTQDPEFRAKVRASERIDWSSWQLDGREVAESGDDGVEVTRDTDGKHGPWTEWSRVIEFKVIVPIPERAGEFSVEAPFDYLWQPSDDLVPEYYYAISAESSGKLKTTRSGVFQVVRRTRRIDREIRIGVYQVLQSFGLEPDPFFWLR